MKSRENGLRYPLADLKKVCKRWLYLEDDQMIDVMMATHVANRFQTDPLWLIFVAPPSNTKTELLRSFDGHKDCYFLSNLTPATLVSGIIPKGNRPDPSLLPTLNDKTLIIKDFTTILSMKHEAKAEILAQLREIYDGHYTKDFGNGKRIDWHGKVGVMAACTPVFDKHYGIIGSLGDRFLLYRTEVVDNDAMGLQAQKIVGREDAMRAEIRDAAHKFVQQFDELENTEFDHDEIIDGMIVQLACFVAYARCPVDRDRTTSQLLYLPLPEGPARLVKQLTQLGMGLSLTHGKNVIDLGIYEIIKKVGRDLVSAQRIKVLKYLWEEKALEILNDSRTTKQVAEAVNMPTTTVRVVLEDLMIVGLLNRTRESDTETAPYLWQFNKTACRYAEGADVFCRSEI